MVEIKNISIWIVATVMLFVSTFANAESPNEIVWYEKDLNNQPIIHLYFSGRKNARIV